MFFVIFHKKIKKFVFLSFFIYICSNIENCKKIVYQNSMGNTFGKIFRLTTFGESHSAAIGGIIDGCPSDFLIDFQEIDNELHRRKPISAPHSTKRNETDKIEFLSGIFQGKTTGTPIGFIIRNVDANNEDYEILEKIFRPSHADFTFEKKYGFRDFRSGGRASARETATRIVAGAIAKQFLATKNIEIVAFTSQISTISLKESQHFDFSKSEIEKDILRCPDSEISEKMMEKINEARKNSDSVGGIITCVVRNIPAGLGEPTFDKFHAQLAKAIFTIPAAKGFEIGGGFSLTQKTASESNDIFFIDENKIRTKTNFSGGVQGGITNGENVYFRVAFKPTPTISQEQKTVNKEGKEVIFKSLGRNDVCFIPRAVPIVEAMTAMTIFDFYLLQFGYNSFKHY